MGTSLAGLLPQNTYSGLLKFGDNAALSATLRAISDGAGNDTMLSISTTALQIGGATGLNWDNTNKRLGIGTNAPSSTLQVVGDAFVRYGGGSTDGLLQVGTNGGGFIVSSANRTDVSLKTNAIMTTRGTGITFRATAGEPNGAVVGVVGSGSTSATTSLLVQNSAGSNIIQGTDDGTIAIGTGSTLRMTGGGSPRIRGFNDISIEDDGSVHLKGIFGGNTRLPQTVIVGANTTQNASAQLQIDSTTKGVLPPRMTTTQKNAIASPAAGLEMYDSTAKSPAYYDGTNWGYTGGALQNTTGNGGTLNVSFAAGNIVNLTLNATTTLTFANAVIGTYIVQVTQSAGGGSSLVYPASVKWAGGTAPTLSTAVGKTDILTFYHDGTNYYGTYSLNY